MFLLLLTIPALLASPATAHASIVVNVQEIAIDHVAHEYAALAAFERSVQDYMSLHRRLVRVTPPLLVTADPTELRTAVDSLGQAIRLARPEARRGDLFTDAVARVLRRRIGCALWQLDVVVLVDEMEEDAEPDVPLPVVNQTFPWGTGNAIWPSVLALLPQLPEELEYRFVGVDLVLIDVRANLVVDILEGALPLAR